MRFVPFNENGMLWVENCQDCQRAMKKVCRDSNEVLVGRPDTYKYRPYPRAFAAFAQNPIITSNDLWFCEGCTSVWAPAAGHWVKVILTTEINQTYIPAQAQEIVFDPGPQPFPESTKCPHCHCWREQRGDWQVCGKCGGGEQVLIHRQPDFSSIPKVLGDVR